MRVKLPQTVKKGVCVKERGSERQREKIQISGHFTIVAVEQNDAALKC